MKHKLTLHIEAGEKTCASEPGKFCRFVGTRKYGTVFVCTLFPPEKPGYKEPGATTELGEDGEGGWLLRCQACLDATQT